MRRKEERSKQVQTNNKAKQYSTPKIVTFLKKKELPQVVLEPISVSINARAPLVPMGCNIAHTLSMFVCTHSQTKQLAHPLYLHLSITDHFSFTENTCIR